MKKLAALPLLASIGLLTSCVGAPASTYEVSGDVVCPVAGSEESGQFRIGYQVFSSNSLYLRDQSLVEACLPNVEVSWVRFPTGQDVVQGLVSRSVDIGIMGSPPATNALSQPINLDAAVIRVNTSNNSNEALVGREATTLEELRGKRIATGFASTAHYALIKALESAGMENDVEIVNMSPDVLPGAWQNGDVDAAFIWGPALAEISKTGNLIASAGDVAELGSPTYNLDLAMSPFVEAHPEVVQTWIDLCDWAADLYHSSPEEFIQANAVQTGLSVEETAEELAGAVHFRRQDQAELSQEVGEQLYKTAQFLQDQRIATAREKQHYVDAVQLEGK